MIGSYLQASRGSSADGSRRIRPRGPARGAKDNSSEPRPHGPTSPAARNSRGPTRANALPRVQAPPDSHVKAVCAALELAYGRPRLGNPRDPLSDLVFVILSNRASPVTYRRVYANLRTRYPSWSDVLNAPRAEMVEILRPAGLAQKKAGQIRATLEKIQADFGSCDLRRLKTWERERVLDYLQGLPGVSGKVARCVMLYSLDLPVLPVDAHTLRLASRLGWIRHTRAERMYEPLEKMVPPELRYVFHVGAVQHGRSVCRAARPLCNRCALIRLCAYGSSITKGRCD